MTYKKLSKLEREGKGGKEERIKFDDFGFERPINVRFWKGEKGKTFHGSQVRRANDDLWDRVSGFGNKYGKCVCGSSF